MFSAFSNYPTFLVFLAVVFAAALTMIVMPAFIRFLRSSNVGQQVRADGPQSHLVKQGTPTMGGLMMLVAVAITVLLVCPLSVRSVLLLAVTLLAGALGLIDDASKVVHERSLGLTPKAKLVGQFAIATVFCLVAVNMGGISPVVTIPFVCDLDLGILTTTFAIGGSVIAIPWLYLIFVNILMVGMCNAVNLTDGLDGLAAGTVMVVMIVFAAIAYRSDLLDASVLSAALAGACIGFLWFNAHPAQMFMGDVGALALGGALGTLAVIVRQEILLAIMGGVFVAETVSVMLQVSWFKYTKKKYGEGRRIFRMAPLHHHFEQKGWKETKVVIRFWIITIILVLIGLATLKMK